MCASGVASFCSCFCSCFSVICSWVCGCAFGPCWSSCGVGDGDLWKACGNTSGLGIWPVEMGKADGGFVGGDDAVMDDGCLSLCPSMEGDVAVLDDGGPSLFLSVGDDGCSPSVMDAAVRDVAAAVDGGGDGIGLLVLHCATVTPHRREEMLLAACLGSCTAGLSSIRRWSAPPVCRGYGCGCGCWDWAGRNPRPLGGHPPWLAAVPPQRPRRNTQRLGPSALGS